MYKRANSKDWTPIPAYAHPKTWSKLENYFGYLYGEKDAPGFKEKLLEKRNVDIWKNINLDNIIIKAFKTYHCEHALGSVGYVIEDNSCKIAYTSDFSHIVENEDVITDGKSLDVLVIEANWFNEPKENKYGHMSFQNAIQYIKKWKPRQVYFVHCGDEDLTIEPKNPIIDPKTNPNNIPKTYCGWNKAIKEFFEKDGQLSKYLNQKDGNEINFIGYEGFKIEV